MGGKQSTNNNNDDGHDHNDPTTRRSCSTLAPAGGGPGATAGFTMFRSAASGTSGADGSNSARQRARSLISVPNGHQPISIPSSSDEQYGAGVTGSPESDSSTPDENSSGAFARGVFAVHSLPAQLLSFNGKFRCIT